MWNAVLRLSDIPLQAIGGAKKQNDCLVDTDPTAANSKQIIIGCVDVFTRSITKANSVKC